MADKEIEPNKELLCQLGPVHRLLCQNDGKRGGPFQKFRSICNLVGMDSSERLQRDAADFYDLIMNALKSKNLCGKARKFNFLKCLLCGEIKGSMKTFDVLNVKVLDTNERLPVKDLIHNALTKKFFAIESPENIESTFLSHCEEAVVWESSMIQQFLAVIAFKLHRTTGHKTLLQSQVMPDQDLDLTNFSIQNNARKVGY